MSRTVTIADILAAGPRGWPRSAYRMRLALDRRGVPWEAGPRGVRLYRVEDLPEDLWRALERPAPPSTPLRRDANGLDDRQRRVAEARAALLVELDRLAGELGSRCRARAELVARLRRVDDPRLVELARTANARSGGAAKLSRATLERWERLREEGGFAALAPSPARARGRTPDHDWLLPLLSFWARPGKPSLAQAVEALAEARPELRLPSLRTVQRVVAGLPAVARLRGRMGPRELRSVRPYVVRSVRGLEPADVYIADGHTHDQLVRHPITGRPFRPEIVTVVDVATRRVVGWSAGIAESAWLVADALRRACAEAIPAVFYTDRGTGFCNRHLDDPATGVLARLGIRHETSLPYNSQARGVVERLHRSLWVRDARLHPGFVGRDMDPEARKRVERRVREDLELRGDTRAILSWQAFLSWCAERVAAYNARPHAALPRVEEGGRRRHLSPDEAWEAARRRGFEPVTATPEELEELFRPREERVVHRGGVRLFDARYAAPELEAWHGRRVLVAYDVRDPSRVWVSCPDGRFVCEARLDPGVPYMPKARIEAAREAREQARILRLERRAAAVRSDLEGLSRATTPSGPVPLRRDDVPVEAQRRLAAEMAREREPDSGETRADRYDRWKAISERLARGEPVSEAERRWHAVWPETPEGRSVLRDIEEWGEELALRAFRRRQLAG